MVVHLAKLFMTPSQFKNMIKKGLADKRTTTFFILQIAMCLLFACLYYLSVIFDERILLIKTPGDDLQASFFEALYFSLITQTTVGYSGGYNYLSNSGRIINCLHLFSMLAVFVLI